MKNEISNPAWEKQKDTVAMQINSSAVDAYRIRQGEARLTSMPWPLTMQGSAR
jgi:hypothetical protein